MEVINKKIINTMLIYFLRNHWAHDLKLEYLDYDKNMDKKSFYFRYC